MGSYLDFKAIAEAIDVEQVAHLFGLALKRSSKDLRACCPACKSSDERSLQLIPETNSWRCYSANISGDSIALYGHLKAMGMYKAAKELQEHFTASAVAERPASSTAPQKPEGRDNSPKTYPKPAKPTQTPRSSNDARAFDPEAFAEKLEYSPEVAALGISEEDATALGIGVYRGKLYQAARWSNGDTACFSQLMSGELKFPKTLVPPTKNVVPLTCSP